MTSEGLGEVFKGDSTDMCAGKSMGGRANGQACADGERTPIGASENFYFIFIQTSSTTLHPVFTWKWGEGKKEVLFVAFVSFYAMELK
jgi:hypothetical protein